MLSAANAAFASGVYELLLHRTGDDSGVANWNRVLDSGTSPAQVVFAFEASTEFQTQQVRGLYLSILRRTGDTAGVRSWVTQLASGASITDLKAAFLGSAEYLNSHGGTPQTFLPALYLDALGRNIDPAGEAAFTAQMNAGVSSATVARSVVTSAEAHLVEVAGFYKQFLARSPDAAGAKIWSDYLGAGTPEAVVAADILGSSEGYSRLAAGGVQLSTFTFTSPSRGVVGAGNPALTGQITDPVLSAAKLRVQLDGGPFQDVPFDGQGSFHLPLGFRQDGSADGNHTASLAAIDQISGVLTSSSFSFPFDTQPPVLSITGTASGLITASNPVITGQVRDRLSGMATLQAQVDGGTPVAVSFDATGAFRFQTGLPLDLSADGDHTVTLVATDLAGNVSAKASFSFVLDTGVHSTPLNDTVRGAGFSLADNQAFVSSKMQLYSTRRIDDIRFNFYTDKPNVTAWTTAQVDVVMQGVAELNKWTDNNDQLLIDPKYGKVFNFVMTDSARLNQILGTPSSGNWTGVNDDEGTARFIAFLKWDTTDANKNYDEKKTVKHEIGHNFDSSNEKYVAFDRVYPNAGLGTIGAIAFLHWQWIGQSGWEPASNFQLNDGKEIADRTGWDSLFSRPLNQLHKSGDGNWYYLASLPDSNFARDYGKYNPYEDWTTTLELYDDIVDGPLHNTWRTQYSGMTNKLKIMDEFFTIMANRSGTANGNIFTHAELQDYFDHRYTLATGYHGLQSP
jgi:hypothetical protein